MDGWSVAALLCSCLAAVAAVTDASIVKLELEPREVWIATGETLMLNCTISHPAKGFSARGISFKVNSTQLNSSCIVEVLTERTTALKVINIQRNMSGVVECHHRSPDVASDTARVVVADRPKKPRIRDCKVRNWENMSCFWDDQENGIQTNISVSYCLDAYFNSMSRCFACPNRDYAGERSCSWWKYDHDDLFMNSIYWLYIEAKNALGIDYDVRKVDPNEHVQPGGVLNLNCTANSSRSCSVNWDSPSAGKNLSYRIKFKSRLDGQELIVGTDKTSVQLTDLIPAADYPLTVDCIPLVRGKQTGFWSSPELCSCETQTDVPAMNPAVTWGAYHVLTADGSYNRRRNRHIQLHWKPVPRRWSNGEITGIRVRIAELSEFLRGDLDVGSSWTAHGLETTWELELLETVATPTSADGRVLNFSGAITKATVDLDVESAYVLTVEAQTSAGFNESLVPASVVIPKKSEAPPFPEKFVVATDFANRYYTYVNLSTFPNASGYTIYWCYISGNRPDICLGPYDWTMVSPSQMEHRLDLPDYPCSGVRFHVSVESVLPSGETVSSGMMAADAIYSRHGSVAAPENLRSSTSNNKPDSLTVRWDADKGYCRRSVYVSHYVIRYCSNDCHEQTVDGSTDFAVISGLLPGTSYRLQMKSCSFDQESNFTQAISFITPFEPDSLKPTIVIAVSMATAAVVLLFILLLCCRWKLRGGRNNILIVSPKKCSMPEVEIQSDGYRPQAIPRDEDEDPYLHAYARSLSSGDSCHQGHVIGSASTTSEPSDQSSRALLPEISYPNNETSESSSSEYSSVHCNSSTCQRILPDFSRC